MTPDNMTIAYYDRFWNPQMDLHVRDNHCFVGQSVYTTLLTVHSSVVLSDMHCTLLTKFLRS